MEKVKESKPFSVSDIDSIMVGVSLNGVDTKANFESVIDAFEKMRVWHRQIIKGKDDAFRVNYAVQLGLSQWEDVSIKDDYIVTKREIDFSDWVSWIADRIKINYKLKLFSANTPYMEIHVSWSVWQGYFFITRRRKDILITHSHDIMENSWNTRALIMLKLLGHDWTFSYSNRQGEAHYYYGGIQSIHNELIRLATNAYEIANVKGTLSQSDALEALFQFYAKYPDLKVNLLTSRYLTEDIIQLASPQYDNNLRQSALPLLKMIPPEETLSSMERIYELLYSQLEQWKRSIDANRAIVDRMKESKDDISIKEVSIKEVSKQ